ncbi:hypothetical protein MARPU_00410 [Marichromatium purpuratum 984]|uniref:Uncharacterized protein n=1 Tax=Marichromatium purpuratum 984 TaxID=765910 RepID=W0DZR5_MARPU|nr:tetratricopeptide repeat protein [Marichromatium purpuratum]AHF02484.1 hypothetical protein MARPU_00410 [Marichromatium purpuratum 984]
MPRLSALQWLLLVVFLVFYGFAVFAITRDYYLRNPIQVAQAPVAAPDQGVPEPVTGNDPEQLHQRADSLFMSQRYGEAARYYQRILELRPDDPEAYNDLGLSLFYTGDTAGALKALRAGLEIAPELQRMWLTYGFINLQISDTATARAALERARDIAPDNDIGGEAVRLLGLLEQAGD